MYYDILGRAPDQSGFMSAFQTYSDQLNYDDYNYNKIHISVLASQIASTLSCTEFKNIGYKPRAKALVLIRAVLNREADESNLELYENKFKLLDNQSLSDTAYYNQVLLIVNELMATTEFLGSSNELIGVYGALIHWQADLFRSGYPLICKPLTSDINNFGGLYKRQSEEVLQRLLFEKSKNGGGIVYLDQMSVTFITKPLIIPPKVTIKTKSITNNTMYAQMGRLVQVSVPEESFNNYMVDKQSTIILMPSASIQYVWIDGGGSNIKKDNPIQASTAYCITCIATKTSESSSNSTSVQNCRISNISGNSAMKITNPRAIDYPNVSDYDNVESYINALMNYTSDSLVEGRANITNNIIIGDNSPEDRRDYWEYADLTNQIFNNPSFSNNSQLSYATARYNTPGVSNGAWADGISNAASKAYIASNSIIDATDCGIVNFHTSGSTAGYLPQVSTVEYNTIVNIGFPIFAGIVCDTIYAELSSGIHVPFAKGSEIGPYTERLSIKNNTIWNSPLLYMRYGISVGTRNNNQPYNNTKTGFGADVENNIIGTSTTKTNALYGIMIGGMNYTTCINNSITLNNNFDLRLICKQDTSTTPPTTPIITNIVVDISNIGGTITPNYTSLDVTKRNAQREIAELPAWSLLPIDCKTDCNKRHAGFGLFWEFPINYSDDGLVIGKTSYLDSFGWVKLITNSWNCQEILLQRTTDSHYLYVNTRYFPQIYDLTTHTWFTCPL
ncbi:MAG: hypothetical protein SFY80_08790 [Verrucomicrobiota bacterium]|nr:hypothetical protein [Verrucomicrobiota bacterium]